MASARTAPADPHRIISAALRDQLRRRASDLGALLLAGAGLTLLLALTSYRPADSSFDTASATVAHNLAGPIGAMASDLLLQGFGIAGAIPVLAFLAWAVRLSSHRSVGSLTVRLAAMLLAMPTVAATLQSVRQIADQPWPTPAGPGGAVGRLLDPASWLGWRHGPAIGLIALLIVPLGIALSMTLLLLASGLTGGEWKLAWTGTRRCARFLFTAGRVPLFDRAATLVAAPVRPTWAAWFRSREERPAPPVAPEARREPSLVPPIPPAPAEPPATGRLAAAPAAPAATGAGTPRTIRSAGTVRQALQPALPLTEPGWRYPPLDLLKPAPARGATAPSSEALDANARLLETVLSDYGVQGSIVEIRPGPVVTLYELEPAPGIRSARVIGLADDIARSLSVTAVRIATVPGRNVIGIEVPNAKRETVYLSEILGAETVQRHAGRLALALGKDISGAAVVADLQRMPHLMIAGTTGSGKSVGVNAMILSLLYRLPPDQCRLILIDPKMLELSMYEGIPHLMAPVVTEPAKAVTALKWTVREMERRYRAMSQLNVRNIGGFNDRVADARARGEVVTRRVQTGFDPETNRPTFEEQPLALEPMPFIVVVVDEMADLMMVAGKDIEAAVQRLAQMARAAGIHVIMATQRPSVDVITGTIKANFPTRISFQVISKFDSRTILGEMGAEQLLGQGDMLYMAGGGRITRVHGPFVSDEEVEKVVSFLREQGEPAYLDAVTEPEVDEGTPSILPGNEGSEDAGLYPQAVGIVIREGKASTSFLQRHLNIGYNRAAKLIEQMEKEGIISPANHANKREVLIHRGDEER